MSENLDLVRSIYADWERGDYTSADWADPHIEFAFVDGPDPRSWKGLSGMARGWGEFQSMWARGFHADPIEFRELTDEYVLVTVEFVGRAKGSDMDLSQVATQQATVLRIRDGKVVRLALYWDRDRALADLGLEE